MLFVLILTWNWSLPNTGNFGDLAFGNDTQPSCRFVRVLQEGAYGVAKGDYWTVIRARMVQCSVTYEDAFEDVEYAHN